MDSPFETLAAAAIAVLGERDPAAKAARSRAAASAWRAGDLAPPGAPGADTAPAPPDRPGRPDRPVLVPPAGVARRRVNGAPAGRIALLHALAHIELNAIDLA
jgi:uncharacterized ferritin-like protein (DUF455 family)